MGQQARRINGTAGRWLQSANRNFFEISALFACMSSTLAKQFESFAECCLELARSAETTARRSRFIQMAHDYRLATFLIRDLAAGPLSAKPAAARLLNLSPSGERPER